MMRRGVFLDRDGTLNEDHPGYIKSWAEFHWLPDIVVPLRQLQAGGFELIIVTNQAAIAKGLTTRAKVEEIHQMMVEKLATAGVCIRAVYCCPHGESDGCDCRKPKPGLLLRAARECDISLALSWVVGDQPRDLEAGRAAGCRVVRVSAQLPLSHAANLILAQSRALGNYSPEPIGTRDEKANNGPVENYGYAPKTENSQSALWSGGTVRNRAHKGQAWR